MTVRLVLKNQDGVNIVCLETIKFTEEETTFLLPIPVQPSTHHIELFNLPSVKNAGKNLKKAGHYRNVKIILRPPLDAMYIDEAGNFIFGEYVLEELERTSVLSEESNTDVSSDLLNIIRHLKLEDKQKTPKWDSIEKKFAIEKFSGKEKATEWLMSFENECARHEMKADPDKIKCLRLFLVENALDWYKSNAIKVKDETWSAWSASFLEVYADKGWTKVRHAYNYKHLGGSLMDYALKKERLMLEVESRVTQYSMINQIVIGLPISIQDRLDREEIQTTDELMNKLRQYESTSAKSSTKFEKYVNAQEISRAKLDPKKRLDREPRNVSERKPCPICESQGYVGRFHPAERCRNRYKRFENISVNLNEGSDDDVSETRETKNE